MNKSGEFLSVVRQHKGIIYKIVNSYCADAEDRKDLAQEIIIQLWKSFEKYDTTFKYSTWIYRIALNVSISFLRKEVSRKKINNTINDNFFELSEQDISEQPESNLTILQVAIFQLKELDKALILLYLEEKSYKEISEILGISETNISTKISRIKQLLKQKITHLQNT
ncbi:RNA polymerase sigma-70 factor, ECF subfamily [Flexibacter flexilis DSM 6793]|uniref:RNA polymerase sigma-70 factor, ECF subfamily n=1 Tax=Flexibacter flexilis DSM 6793 TaxID=927664 RepID=A0A1I1DI48_9BACT|nr:RNA polymerase sigma factor [Flexibacter flexilis]SFB74591.1 RNA polymerase sigma-70 factor, ECF subfamily [Flexibacter flexilis DSM 6793]